MTTLIAATQIVFFFMPANDLLLVLRPRDALEPKRLYLNFEAFANSFCDGDDNASCVYRVLSLPTDPCLIFHDKARIEVMAGLIKLRELGSFVKFKSFF